jgi:hypothetical protein
MTVRSPKNADDIEKWIGVIGKLVAAGVAPGNCINLAEMRLTSNVLRRLAAVVAIGAVCASCATQFYDSPNTLGVLPAPKPVPLWLGAIHGTGTTGVSGAAAVTPSPTPGWTHVLISIDNSVAGGEYGWSLKSGSCAAQGNVIGPTNRYADFIVRADGSGAAEATVPETLSPSASYAVVATPAASATTPAACADLVLRSM